MLKINVCDPSGFRCEIDRKICLLRYNYVDPY